MSAIDCIMVGAGGRGLAYGNYALAYPQELKIIGVAEPNPERRQHFAELHSIAPDMIFDDWQSLLASGRKRAAAIINCTMDRLHFESTMPDA